MNKNSKVFRIVLIVIVVLLLAKILFVYQGPVNGVVIDANTGQPVAGAIVNVGNHERLTDKSGKYHFHAEIGLKNYLIYLTGAGQTFPGVIACTVYKDGYAAYCVDLFSPSSAGSFLGDNQPFRQKSNIVRLYRLPSDDPEVYRENISWICGHGIYGPLTEKAVESERKKAMGEKYYKYYK